MRVNVYYSFSHHEYFFVCLLMREQANKQTHTIPHSTPHTHRSALNRIMHYTCDSYYMFLCVDSTDFNQQMREFLV